jgi:excisionase family DNA binding protein
VVLTNSNVAASAFKTQVSPTLQPPVAATERGHLEHRLVMCPEPTPWRDPATVTEEERKRCVESVRKKKEAGVDLRRDPESSANLLQYGMYVLLQLEREGKVGPLDGKEGLGDKLLTVDELAALLAVPRGWVYRKARANGLPFVKLGKYLRFEESQVRRWIECQRSGPSADYLTEGIECARAGKSFRRIEREER